jgi:hypothetical protein
VISGHRKISWEVNFMPQHGLTDFKLHQDVTLDALVGTTQDHIISAL